MRTNGRSFRDGPILTDACETLGLGRHEIDVPRLSKISSPTDMHAILPTIRCSPNDNCQRIGKRDQGPASKPYCAAAAGLPFPPPGNRTRPCGFEDRRAPDTLTGSSQYSALARSRTWSATFGRSRAIPSHSKGNKRRSAGVQGFEPCRRALEARCSPRSTPLQKVKGKRQKGKRERKKKEDG